MANPSTVVNNSWDNRPADCSDDDVAANLGGNHPKRQPPNPSPFAPAPGAGGIPLAPPTSVQNPNQNS